MPNLYPTVKLPTIVAPTTPNYEKKYKPAPKFDFQTGDFVRDGANRLVFADGKETFMAWCIKICATERNSKLGYSDKIGVEFEAAVKKKSIEAVKSSIQRTITEALMVNPVTEYVRDFNFNVTEGDNLLVSFKVKGRQWAEELAINIEY